MANQLQTSIKHLQIDKAQSTMLAVVASAVFVTIFSLVGTHALLVKGSYQHRVVNAENKVIAQLKTNIASAQTLVTQYNVFVAEDPNVLGGSTTGNGSQDGDNARISLDALPSTYDAPAVASSVEKLLLGRNVSITSLDVKDVPASNPDAPTISPIPALIPFSFSGTTTYPTALTLTQDFENSIRPFDITNLEISGTDTALKIVASGDTYFQPGRSLDLSATKVVK